MFCNRGSASMPHRISPSAYVSLAWSMVVCSRRVVLVSSVARPKRVASDRPRRTRHHTVAETRALTSDQDKHTRAKKHDRHTL
jgi:hypothetical protein